MTIHHTWSNFFYVLRKINFDVDYIEKYENYKTFPKSFVGQVFTHDLSSKQI